MNVVSVLWTSVAGVLLVSLPRRSAIFPLLLTAAYTPAIPVIEIGPANLSPLRVLVFLGLVRAVTRGERLANRLLAIDVWILMWAVLLVSSSIFHTPDAWVFRLGLIVEQLGVYFLFRVFLRNLEDVRRLFIVLGAALLPLAALMLAEKYTAQNYFAIMGAKAFSSIREGHVRAQGPFSHEILAGTVGATCIPMALCLWRSNRSRAVIGLLAAGGIVFASTSSGPIMMTGFICIGLFLWNYRARLSLVRWGAVTVVFALQMAMHDPVYFLMARIDITGGSTGWYRAQLIRSSIAHLSEWWAIGTDYTRHWMPTGIYANSNNTDITNHFLAQGVMGGLPLLVLFALILVSAFRAVGRTLRDTPRQPADAYLIWTLGATLFGQVMNCFSISLFDQSSTFLYLTLASIGAVQVVSLPAIAAGQPARPVPAIDMGVVSAGGWTRKGREPANVALAQTIHRRPSNVLARR